MGILKGFLNFFFVLGLAAAGMTLLHCASAPSAASSAARADDLASVVSDFVDHASSLLRNRKTIRVAVVTFTPTQKDFSAKNDFGQFVSEQITGGLAGVKEGIRLFERSRLDAIVSEQALSATELMDGEAAKVLGNLAPIDYIITGAFTALPSAIRINGRMIDVVTGEIVATVNTEMPLTEELKSFFAPAPETVPNDDSPYVSPEDSCEKVTADILRLMKDLTTQTRRDSLITAALAVPFDTACGYVHNRLMSLLEHSQLDFPAYRDFLVKTLAAIEVPDDDSRALDIVSFFGKTGTIGSAEWNAGLAALCRSGTYLHSYVDYLIHEPALEKKDLKTAYERIDAVMALGRQNKIGRPLPLSFDKVFAGVAAGCGIYSSDSDSRCAVYLFDKHRAGLSPKAVQEERESLKHLYGMERDAKTRRMLLSWIIESYNAAPSDKKSAEDLLYFLKQLLDGSEGTGQDLAWFAAQCKNVIQKCLPLLAIRSQRDEAISLCIPLGIAVPGLVPTVDELGTLIFSDTPSVQMASAEYLNHYGAKAAPLEKKVVKLLRRSERLNYSGTTNLRWSLIGILGNIRTVDSESIHELIGFLTSTDYCVPDSAMHALAKIGLPAVPALKAVFDSSETYVQIRIVGIFGQMGRAAASEAGYLKNILTKTDNAYLRDAVEDALEKITGSE